MQFLMQKLLAIEQNTFDEYSALVKYSLLLKMLRLLLTRCRSEKQPVVCEKRRSLESDAIAVKNYIEINFRRKIMIGELAELIHYDPRSFTPYFKKLTGKRFTDYLQEVRTVHALEDYLTYDIPVGEEITFDVWFTIATPSGFEIDSTETLSITIDATGNPVQN